MDRFQTVNPATSDIIQSYAHMSWFDAESAIQAAHYDFERWRKTSFSQRSQIVRKLAEALRNNKQKLATTMQLEMGKLQSEGLAEVEKCAVTCEYYAQEAEAMLSKQVPAGSPYARAEVCFQPLGVVFSIMPWNFPLWQVIRFAAPALMAGNIVLLKHADLTAGTAELIEEVFRELSSEYQLLRNLHVNHEVASQVIAHPWVQGVTFTGSTRGGRAVAMEAAKNLKKTVLELGGNDAYLVLADADVQLAAKLCAQSRLLNCGQSCVSAKRFIVDKAVAKDFIRLLVEEMKGAQLAPLAAKKFQSTIIEQVEMLKKWGGQVVLGGTAPEGAGASYPASILVFEQSRPEVHREEVFGPVASVFIVENTREAIDLANSSPYGLGGGIFSRDIVKAQQIAREDLQAGFVVVNDFVKSDPRIPFGGIKDSGYGRELGHFGILEFVNIKTLATAGS